MRIRNYWIFFKFRSFILESPLSVIVDNKALQFLRTCKFARWILAIQENQPHIVHCSGKEIIRYNIASSMCEEWDENAEGLVISITKIQIKTSNKLKT